jgi:hypothetical protein
MTAKQFGQKDKHPEKQQQQEGNLGQREARLEKEKQSELSHMGEAADESEAKRKGKHHSD